MGSALEGLVDVEASGIRTCSGRVLDALFAQCLEGNVRAIDFWLTRVDAEYLPTVAPRRAAAGEAVAEDEAPPTLPFRLEPVSA